MFFIGKIKKVFFVIVIIVAILVGFGFGFYYGEIEGKAKIAPVEGLDFSLFWEVYHTLQERYVHPEDIDNEKIMYGAISGMTASLDDPYTVFLDPESSKIFDEDIKGEFQGVGMEIGIKEGRLTVIAPLEGTPAQKAGMRAGDKIIKVGDIFTYDLTIEEAVKLIRGPKKTEVILTVFRDDWTMTKEIKIIRDVIQVPSLKWELKQDNIAYIKLYHFTENADSDFKKISLEILDSPAEKIILDLRNNPGGYLHIAKNIAGWFLEKGQLVVIEDFSRKNEKQEYKSNGSSEFQFFPLVVLINEGSASASEILAGALRDNKGTKLVGKKSFGKGTVQMVEKLKQGSLKITVANWLTPNGHLITNKGLEPDIEVEITEQDFEKDIDPQLDMAIEIIEEMN